MIQFRLKLEYDYEVLHVMLLEIGSAYIEGFLLCNFNPFSWNR